MSYTSANLTADVVVATPPAAHEAMGITPEILAQATAEIAQRSVSPQAPQAVAVKLTRSHGLKGEAPIQVSMKNFPSSVIPGKKYMVKEPITGVILNPMSESGAVNGWISATLNLDDGEELPVAITVNQSLHYIGEEVTVKSVVFSLDTYQGVQSLSGIVTLPKKRISEDDF